MTTDTIPYQETIVKAKISEAGGVVTKEFADGVGGGGGHV